MNDATEPTIQAIVMAAVRALGMALVLPTVYPIYRAAEALMALLPLPLLILAFAALYFAIEQQAAGTRQRVPAATGAPGTPLSVTPLIRARRPRSVAVASPLKFRASPMAPWTSGDRRAGPGDRPTPRCPHRRSGGG